MSSKTTRLGWVVCANISDHLHGGRNKGLLYQGTRKFSAGTKVYLGDPFRGMGGQSLYAARLHRVDRGWTHCIIKTDVLTNIRLCGVYSPRKWEHLEDQYASTFEEKEGAFELLEYVVDSLSIEQPEKLKPRIDQGPSGGGRFKQTPTDLMRRYLQANPAL